MDKKISYIVKNVAKRLLPLSLLTLLPLLSSCGEFFEFDKEDAVPAGEMILGRTSVDLMIGDRFEIPVSFAPSELSNEEVFCIYTIKYCRRSRS